jgi:hypothetical protein
MQLPDEIKFTYFSLFHHVSRIAENRLAHLFSVYGDSTPYFLKWMRIPFSFRNTSSSMSSLVFSTLPYVPLSSSRCSRHCSLCRPFEYITGPRFLSALLYPISLSLICAITDLSGCVMVDHRDGGPSDLCRREFADPRGCSNDIALDVTETSLKEWKPRLIPFVGSAAF